ncbi:MAG TPA: ribonuclease P protein component [Acidimicrobiales bacterium]|nr:ribonuclease P protein component [Acidimicrobiales bacterium]
MIGRIRDRATFDALRREGRRVRRGPVTVTFVPGAPDDGVRVAYAIGRRVGAAVVRNRLRRQLRAAVREVDVSRGGLAAGAYLVGLRPEAAGRSFGELRSALDGALGQLASRTGAGTPP